MSQIDISSYLNEVSPGSPAGEDLGYDPEYLSLFKLAEGKAETQWSAAEDPNWREVRDGCAALLKRTKDLRVVTLLMLALLKLEGLSGLAAGMGLLRGILEKYWATLHPRLDEDDGDPLERINAIVAICPPPGSFNDPMRFRERLRDAPLAASPRWGRFSLRDIGVATGKLPPPTKTNGPLPDEKNIDAAFGDTPAEQLRETNQAASTAATDLEQIETLLSQNVGAGRAPNLTELRNEIAEILAATSKQLAKRSLPHAAFNAGHKEPAVSNETLLRNPTGVGADHAGGAVAAGEIRSDQDVVEMLDRICRFYENTQPSSPIPLLLRRAKRLVSKSFLQIVRDLSPDALTRLELISGVTADETGEK